MMKTISNEKKYFEVQGDKSSSEVCRGLETEVRHGVESGMCGSVNSTIADYKSILTIRETASRYGFPEHTLRRLIRENRVPCIRVGNRAYLNPTVFEAFLESRGEMNERSN